MDCQKLLQLLIFLLDQLLLCFLKEFILGHTVSHTISRNDDPVICGLDPWLQLQCFRTEIQDASEVSVVAEDLQHLRSDIHENLIVMGCIGIKPVADRIFSLADVLILVYMWVSKKSAELPCNTVVLRTSFSYDQDYQLTDAHVVGRLPFGQILFSSNTSMIFVITSLQILRLFLDRPADSSYIDAGSRTSIAVDSPFGYMPRNR